MKILSIGSDKSLFDENSAVRKRIIEYGKLVEEMHIVVFTKRQSQISNLKSQNFGNTFLYPTNSYTKWLYIFDAYKIAKKVVGNWKLEIGNSRRDIITTSQDPFEAGLVGWLLKRKFNIPLHLQIHTDFLSPYFWQESFLNKIRVMLAKFLIPRADCIRVVSRRIKNSLLKLPTTNYQLPTINVLPIFIDVKKIQEIPITIDLRKKYPQFNFIILIASRLTKEKNIDLAIEALAKVVKKHPKIGMIIVGDGAELKNLKSQISNLKITSQNSNLDKQIIFEDWQEKETLISYYKTADLFLLTSNYEGYGMSVVEAMAAGCPVVMTDIGLDGEVLIDKKNGLVAPIGNRQKLTEAIFSLMENPELREHLANNAKKITDFWPSKNEYLNAYYQDWTKCRS